MATMTDERERERECDTRGQFAEETTDDDILRVIRESEFPVVTALGDSIILTVRRQRYFHTGRGYSV